MVNTLKNDSMINAVERGGNTAFLLRLLREQCSVTHLAIAVSGGLDSMALLSAALILAKDQQLTLTVLHVHHGLQMQADEWLLHVQRFCHRHQIQCVTHHLDAQTRKNAQSIEDWARHARYEALSQMALNVGAQEVWLAQHEDDQIETYLLQKARGAGVRGLSSMPSRFIRHGMSWQRPWLSASKEQLSQWIQDFNVQHIHDPSNDDVRFARNVVRLEVQKMTSDERALILEAVAQAQQQNQQEFEWAHRILVSHQSEYRSEIGELGRLHHVQLERYSLEEQMLLMRAWFAHMGLRMPMRTALLELLKQLNNSKIDQHMCWQSPDGWAVAKFRHDIIAAKILPKGSWFLSSDLQKWILEQNLEIRVRQGGERVHVHSKRHSISLKQAYQDAGVAPMLRAQLPLLYRDGELVYVVGVGSVHASKPA